MSQQFLFPNFYNTTLSASLSSTATTMSVTTSTGLPTLLSGQVIPLILTPKSSPGSTYEIVYVTGISGTTLTIERGMEGTSAQTWNSGDIVLCGPTGESVAPVRSWHAPVASETLPVGNDLLVMPGTLGAAITLTLPSTGMVVGNKYRIYGSASAYAVTVALSNSTGSPFIHLPDGTEVYSYVLPASSSQNGIELEWDGTNWKGFNFGVMNIPNATANNNPVALGQMMGPASVGGHLGSLAASTTYTETISFTAPSAGYVWAQARTAFSAQSASDITVEISINGTVLNTDIAQLPMTEAGVVQVSANESVSCVASLITDSTSPGTGGSLYVDAIFIPALQQV